mgnify:CR=1 FL=1
MKDDVIICRCEDITLKEIRELIKEGYTTLDEIKRALRLVMGSCFFFQAEDGIRDYE